MIMDNQFRKYLGDGIEFNFDGHQVILTGQTGRVYLKPQIVETFKSALTGLNMELKHKKRTDEDLYGRIERRKL
jgi:hypothetical protein